MEKIYIITETTFDDQSLETGKPIACETEEDAKREMKRLIKKANCKSWIRDMAEETTDISYLAYEKGRMNDRSYSVMIHETPVIKAKEQKTDRIIAYTDGGYHLYKNEGAYAFVILQNDKVLHKEATVIRDESNNRGELKAIINAVNWCPDNSEIEVRSDSQYAINTLSGNWKRNKNRDLFEQWDEILEKKKPKVTFEWVHGHSGNKYNEMCDQMCNEAVGYDLNSWIPKKEKTND